VTTSWSEDEEEYVRYLAAERRGYAWVLQRYGGRSPRRAEEEAVEVYAYEPPDAAYRGLVFHETAWHWAMNSVFGARYATEHPELAFPSEEYERETAL
jgi:hypothetical protein